MSRVQRAFRTRNRAKLGNSISLEKWMTRPTNVDTLGSIMIGEQNHGKLIWSACIYAYWESSFTNDTWKTWWARVVNYRLNILPAPSLYRRSWWHDERVQRKPLWWSFSPEPQTFWLLENLEISLETCRQTRDNLTLVLEGLGELGGPTDQLTVLRKWLDVRHPTAQCPVPGTEHVGYVGIVCAVNSWIMSYPLVILYFK